MQQNNNVEARLRTMRTLWFALLASLPMYLAFTSFAMQRGQTTNNDWLSFVFAGVATFMVILSFAVKKTLLRRAVETQDIKLVQPAFVVAWAMCEVSALLGVVEYVVAGTRDYIVLFLLSAVGMLLHFPTRQHLINASYKKL
jgi:cation transport ATPase